MYCCCLKRFRCTGNNRHKQELKVFETDPLIRQPFVKRTPETIANLLYAFVRQEIQMKIQKVRETHFLGSELTDEFRCLLCGTQKHSTYIQFEIDNRFFGNMWNGNQYIVQYVCLPCSKKLQPQLVKTIDKIKQDIRTIWFLLLVRKLVSKPHLVRRILAFLDPKVLSLKAITYNRSTKTMFQTVKVEDDLSIWVSETFIR